MPFPHLSQSYKGRFPFTLAAPSFIYPADYTTNVKHLAPYLDQIELLFFDSARKGDLPGRALIQQLSVLARDLNISYNIHLPTDIDLGSPEAATRQKAIDVIQYILDLTASLEPWTYTLHLPFNGVTPKDVNSRCERMSDSLQRLLSNGPDSRKISIENLHDPFEWIAPIITRFDFSVCLDCGHLFFMGEDLRSVFNQYAARITILHLHGAADDQDHLALNRLTKPQIHGLMHVLSGFDGVVAVEVFSFARLQASLDLLAKHFPQKQSN